MGHRYSFILKLSHPNGSFLLLALIDSGKNNSAVCLKLLCLNYFLQSIGASFWDGEVQATELPFHNLSPDLLISFISTSVIYMYFSCDGQAVSIRPAEGEDGMGGLVTLLGLFGQWFKREYSILYMPLSVALFFFYFFTFFFFASCISTLYLECSYVLFSLRGFNQTEQVKQPCWVSCSCLLPSPVEDAEWGIFNSLIY